MSRSTKRAVTVPLLGFFASVLAGVAPAQEVAPAGTFGEVIDVRVVNLEVVVTGRDGEHVPDLAAGDFRLLVDGKPVPISYFTEVRERAAVAPIAVAGDPAAPVAPPPPAAAGAEPIATSLVLFVDELFGTPWHRERALAALEAQLPLLRPEDRLIAVTFDGTDLARPKEWATGPDAIRRTLRELRGRPGRAARPISELAAFDARRSRPAVSSNVVAEIRRLTRDVVAGVRAAELTLRAFASEPGRKVMLLASGGWPRDPGTYLYGLPADMRLMTEIRSAGGAGTMKRALDDLAATANLLGYTVYPVDVPGKMRPGGGGISAAESGTEVVGSIGILPADPNAPPGVQPLPPLDAPLPEEPESIAGPAARGDGAEREIEIEATLLHVAEQTGGRALLDGRRDVALGEVLRDVASYYWLGFTPTRARDDRVHRVEVEVLRPDLRVRARKTYRDASPRADVTMAMEGALLFESHLTGGRLGIATATPRKVGRRLEIPIEIQIPLDGIAFLPAGKEVRADLELRVACLDEDGDRSDLPVVPVRLSGPQAPRPGSHAVYATALRVTARRQRIALAIFDPATNTLLSGAFVFDPAADRDRSDLPGDGVPR